MKVNVSILLVLLLCFTGAGALFAADQAAGAPKVQVDGRDIVFPDAKPYTVGESVYIPVRSAAENMGILVTWDAKNKSVQIGEGASAVTFKPENAAGGGKPFLKDGRVYVDPAFIQDKLGAEAVWNQQKSAVSITTKSKNLLKGVQLFKQSMVKLTGEKVIYVDPYKVDGEPKDGDIIFITHTHGDHFSLNEIAKVAKKDATIVFPAGELDKLADTAFEKVGSAPNQEGTVKGISYKAVPAYNTKTNNHPKEKAWVGYIIKVNGASYYMAGDTDLIPEMKDIHADVAFLPMGGTYTMAYEEAAQAANLIHPHIVVPYHYADVVGTREDALKFIDAIEPGITSILMKE
ncbi:MBL fold metallo-hydrolase [Paenibacillus thalictri]|nr:stalk domain-containing protein [Paenibacillus thalictri]